MTDAELDEALVKAMKEANKHDDDRISTIREDSDESNEVTSTHSQQSFQDNPLNQSQSAIAK